MLGVSTTSARLPVFNTFSMATFNAVSRRFQTVLPKGFLDFSNSAICAKLPLVLTAALAIQRLGASMTAFGKATRRSRNGGIDSMVVSVDDRFGLTAVIHNLDGSAPAAQPPATSAMRRKRTLQMPAFRPGNKAQ